jgi:hypothetical protein
MTTNNQKEMLSIAYVRAIVAAAGLNVGRMDIDDDSIDIEVAARGPFGTVRSPKLDLQLKCTATGMLTTDYLSLQISMKNYDDLRHQDYETPRILVAVVIPDKLGCWLHQTNWSLAVHH